MQPKGRQPHRAHNNWETNASYCTLYPVIIVPAYCLDHQVLHPQGQAMTLYGTSLLGAQVFFGRMVCGCSSLPFGWNHTHQFINRLALYRLCREL